MVVNHSSILVEGDYILFIDTDTLFLDHGYIHMGHIPLSKRQFTGKKWWRSILSAECQGLEVTVNVKNEGEATKDTKETAAEGEVLYPTDWAVIVACLWWMILFSEDHPTWPRFFFRVFGKAPRPSYRISIWWLVVTGTMEFWMTFHSVGNFIIPTDELIYFHIFQRGRNQPPISDEQHFGMTNLHPGPPGRPQEAPWNMSGNQWAT